MQMEHGCEIAQLLIATLARIEQEELRRCNNDA